MVRRSSHRRQTSSKTTPAGVAHARHVVHLLLDIVARAADQNLQQGCHLVDQVEQLSKDARPSVLGTENTPLSCSLVRWALHVEELGQGAK